MNQMHSQQTALRHALSDLLSDVEAEARHAHDVFRSWCIVRQSEIEFLATSGNWPENAPRCAHRS